MKSSVNNSGEEHMGKRMIEMLQWIQSIYLEFVIAIGEEYMCANEIPKRFCFTVQQPNTLGSMANPLVDTECSNRWHTQRTPLGQRIFFFFPFWLRWWKTTCWLFCMASRGARTRLRHLLLVGALDSLWELVPSARPFLYRSPPSSYLSSSFSWPPRKNRSPKRLLYLRKNSSPAFGGFTFFRWPFCMDEFSTKRKFRALYISPLTPSSTVYFLRNVHCPFSFQLVSKTSRPAETKNTQ